MSRAASKHVDAHRAVAARWRSARRGWSSSQAALPEARRRPARAGSAGRRVGAREPTTWWPRIRARPCSPSRPSPKAVFTVSAGVGHVLRMPNLPRDVPLIRVEDAGMAPQMIRYALTAAMRFVQRLDTYRRAAARRAMDAASAARACAGHVRRHGTRRHRRRDRARAGGAEVSPCAATRGAASTSRACAATPATRARARSSTGSTSLVNVLPSTPATAASARIATAMMRLADGAHVVNIGRGDALVEEDLLALLDAGKLVGRDARRIQRRSRCRPRIRSGSGPRSRSRRTCRA